jgi:endo-alpha-N-acetylgalactosaminidase
MVVNGWGPMERDMSNGEQAAGDGQQIRLNGVAYTKGLGVHAPSDARYAVGAGCSLFQSSIGIDDRVRPQGSVVFQVFGDGVKIYDSGVLNGSSATRDINVPISAYRELRLVVTDGGNDKNFDHADWANARMSCAAGAAPAVSAIFPVSGAVGVSRQISVTATFSAGMQASSIGASTFSLVKAGSTTTVAATVTYDSTTRAARLSPASALDAGSAYVATVKGGVNGVRSSDGVPLAGDVVWSFSSEKQATPPSGTSSLSDLSPISQTNGLGPVEKDRSNGELGGGDGKAITLNAVVFPKGLGVHAASELRYYLGGNCSSFTAQVGVDDEVGSNGSVVFQVWGDSIKLYDSGRMTGSSSTRGVSVSLAARSELRLVVTDAGDGSNYDHADWARPTLTCR